jgi:cyclohexa-1,5-dienecarbonyl-CoA hydratase
MSEQSKVLVEKRHSGQLLHLTLNAPKANVLDAAMIAGIDAAVKEHGPSPNLKAIAFEGAGKHFSFGASVEEHQADRVAEMLGSFHGMFRTLAATALPTFAIVRGQCLGGGLELASYCSWIFAGAGAKLGQPEIKLAVFPPMASLLLPWRIGGGAAADLCVSGRSVDAAEAFRMGLVHDVSDDPAAACEKFFVEHLGGLSASSVRYAERAVRIPLARRFETDLPAIEKLYLDELMKTHDANEGIAAFLDKRKPAFAGHEPS